MRIQNTSNLVSRGNVSGRSQVIAMLEAGLEAADPYNNTRKLIRIDAGNLIVGCKELAIPGDPKEPKEIFRLSELGDIYVLGAAKGIQGIRESNRGCAWRKINGRTCDCKERR